jgi:hypothetical protein
MPVKPWLILALVAAVTAGATQAPAALVFPIPAGACQKYPCAIDPYPAGAPDVSPSVLFPIPPGSDARGLIQTQMLAPGATGATVLYSAYNADKSYLQTLWIQVMPSRGGYHTMLATCRGTDYPVTPCKV